MGRIRIWSAMALAATLAFVVLFAARRSAAPLRAPMPTIARAPREVPVPAGITTVEHRVQPSGIPTGQLHSKRPTQKQRPVETDVDSLAATPFLAVPYAEPLAPSEQLDVYRVQLPRASLTLYGLPARAGSLDSPVTADVAVGSDGVVRAVRFVH